MEKQLLIELLVDKSLANKILEKDLVEIVTRRMDAKINAIDKCQIIKDSVSNREVKDSLSSLSHNLNFIRSSMSEMRKKTIEVSSTIKNISVRVDEVMKTNKLITNLSYFNVGLALTNIAVDVAGFVIVTEHIKTLEEQIETVMNDVKSIKAIKINEIKSEYFNLIMDSFSYCEKIQYDEEINLDDYQKLISRLCAYLKKITDNFYEQTMPEELYFQIFYSLLGIYTILLNDYNKRHYILKGRMPLNYINFRKPFEEITSNKYIECLEDYYILKKSMHASDAFDAVNTHLLLGVNAFIQIEEQKNLLESLESPDSFIKLEKELDSIIKNNFTRNTANLLVTE